ncbi:MAG TPA: pantoate--beta-alanine ligase [Candidatus Limnocylindrales bacterium]|nr:pantoate--beta-alanine ligase [Candidatus Limnocylindrales bacterium]
MSLEIVRTIAGLREVRGSWGDRGVGLVPTMGAFHDGHVSLIRAARAENERVVVSLFVNPSQFGPGEDLAHYPRDEARDAALAEAEGVALLFVPSAEEMYPPGFSTWVEVGELGAILEGAARPGHFRGVATVCLKLFSIVQPRRAYFGRKDAQQVAVLRRMVRDLDLPLELRVGPTVRDPDGLALSSRNTYLSPEERQQALALPRALEAGLAAQRQGADPVAAARTILDAAVGLAVDYVALADFDGPTLAAAVRAGRTRLIDNMLLTEALT